MGAVVVPASAPTCLLPIDTVGSTIATNYFTRGKYVDAKVDPASAPTCVAD